MSKKTTDDPSLESRQADYAWNWFVFHADQRIKLFNYMLIVFGIFATAVVSAVNNGMAEVAFALCLIAGTLALIFSRLDRRNETLLKFGEDVLGHLEKNWIFEGAPKKIKGRDGYKVPYKILRREGGSKARRPTFSALLQQLVSDAWAGKHRFWLQTIAYLLAVVFFIAGYLIRSNADEVNKRHSQSARTACEVAPHLRDPQVSRRPAEVLLPSSAA